MLAESVIMFRPVAVFGIVGLAALAIGSWHNAWTRCHDCTEYRARCKCGGEGDVRRPKFNDPLSRKRRGDDD